MPNIHNDSNPFIIKVTFAIYSIEEVIYFLTYAFQIKILYDFSRSKLSSLRVEDLILGKDVSLIVYLQTRRLVRC